MKPLTDKRCGTCTWASTSILSLVVIKCKYEPLPDSMAEANKAMHVDYGTTCPCWKEATDATDR